MRTFVNRVGALVAGLFVITSAWVFWSPAQDLDDIAVLQDLDDIASSHPTTTETKG